MQGKVYRTTESILDVLAQEISEINAQALFVFLTVAKRPGETGPRPSGPERFLIEFCSRREGLEGFSL